MKTFIYHFASIILFAALARSDTLLVNHVEINGKGIRFTLTDEPFAGATNWSKQFSDDQIFADAPLFWILQNTTNKDAVLVDQGIQHTFSLKLFDFRGDEIPPTDYGKWMNSGPVIPHKPVAASVHLMRLSPGQINDMTFPALTNVFRFSDAGQYTFEARYWFMNNTITNWQLSAPVRIKVIKRPDKNIIKTSNGISQ
jgi:hypothetical protein